LNPTPGENHFETFTKLDFERDRTTHRIFQGDLSNVSDGEKIKETFYEQLTRAVVRIEEHQSICVPGIDWAYERNFPIGTAFFVEDKYNGVSKFFIVTARHVIEKRADLFTRVKINSKSNKYFVLVLPRNLWV